MPVSTMQFERLHIDPDKFPPSSILRQLLIDAFPTAEELRRFCRDSPLFRPIVSKFGSGQGLDDMVDRVLEHCEAFLLLDELLVEVARANPQRYAHLEPRLRSHEAVRVSGGEPIVVEVGTGLGGDEQRVDSATGPLPAQPEPEGYRDFEILISDREEGGYPVHVLKSPAGEAEGLFVPPFAEVELREALARMEQSQTDEAFLIDFGARLFGALFVDDVRARYAEGVGLTGRTAGLRIRLRLDPPELQEYPWELARDPEKREFLVLSKRSLVTRYLHVPRPTPPLEVEPPLRILVVVAAPRGHKPLDVDAEVESIRQALNPLIEQGTVSLSVEPHVTKRRLRWRLMDDVPHILHYVGHGGLVEDRGVLLVEDAQGQASPLDSRTLGTLLKGSSVRLAVLNACLSGREVVSDYPAFKGRRAAFMGVGPALVDSGLGAVVAMQFSMADASARVFAEDFYAMLARLKPVDECVSRAREALLLEVGLERRDWATPVLFMRAPDGILFRQR